MKCTQLFREKYPVIFINGRRKSGKTYLALWLAENTNLLNRAKHIYIVSPTILNQVAAFNKFNLRLSEKPIFIFDDPRKIDYENDIKPKSLLIFDDTGRINQTNFNKMLIKNRHQRISIIFIGHFSKQLQPEIRANIDYLFTFKPSKISETKTLFEEFLTTVFGYNEENKAKGILEHLQRYEFLIADIPNETYSTGKLIKKH